MVLDRRDATVGLGDWVDQMPVYLHNDRFCRSAKVQHWATIFGSPTAHAPPSRERGVRVLRGNVTLPNAIDGGRRSLCQTCREGVHQLHAAGDPLGFFKHAINLAFGKHVDRTSHIEVSVARVKPYADALIGVGVAE